ncbi:MAG: hypothetical protein ACJAVR_003525 [Paracoccaceae bacterium]
MSDIDPNPNASALDVRVLTQAFLDINMICGLYRPDQGEDMVARSAGAARVADVVVDWHLQPGQSKPAKDIILKLLTDDAAEKGRLRLIAIYTSQAGRREIAAEIVSAISDSDLLNLAVETCADGAITASGLLIVVLNKKHTPPSQGLEMVVEEVLPDRLVEEFAKLNCGLLASFALEAVGAVRRGAHHVLAQYREELDGAFLGHRCSLIDPDDANALAMDMLSSELVNLVELENVAERTLGLDVLKLWVTAHSGDTGTLSTGDAQIALEDAKNHFSQRKQRLQLNINKSQENY